LSSYITPALPRTFKSQVKLSENALVDLRRRIGQHFSNIKSSLFSKIEKRDAMSDAPLDQWWKVVVPYVQKDMTIQD
jgi:hypothetical protein